MLTRGSRGIVRDGDFIVLLIRFELRTQEATQLKMELDKAQETIQAAETLVSKLDGEFKRWSGQVWSQEEGMGFSSEMYTAISMNVGRLSVKVMRQDRKRYE